MDDRGTNWREMLQPGRGGGAGPTMGGVSPKTPLPREEPVGHDPADLDDREYKPWVLQRGRSRPPMLLHLRRFEPKSGLWMGWQLAYHSLIAVEYIGYNMITFDFGSRHFVIEGGRLEELIGHIQNQNIISIIEYSASIWPNTEIGGIITRIIHIGLDQGHSYLTK